MLCLTRGAGADVSRDTHTPIAIDTEEHSGGGGGGNVSRGAAPALDKSTGLMPALGLAHTNLSGMHLLSPLPHLSEIPHATGTRSFPITRQPAAVPRQSLAQNLISRSHGVGGTADEVGGRRARVILQAYLVCYSRTKDGKL